MPYYTIDRADDPRLDVFRQLPSSKAENRAGLFIAEGMWLVRRLLASRYPLHSLLVEQRRLAEIGQELPESADILVIPNGMSSEIVGFHFHRGIVAAGKRLPHCQWRELPLRADSQWILVACIEVQDPENMGAIMRNCAALGASGLILGPKCSDPFSRRVLRVSMGAGLALPIVAMNNLPQELGQIRERLNATLFATVLDENAESLPQIQRPPRTILLFGSEGHGLSPEWINLCDRRLTIPMDPKADSLNVAVASGIVLYHFTRVCAGK